jgi:hypothetical protein
MNASRIFRWQDKNRRVSARKTSYRNPAAARAMTLANTQNPGVKSVDFTAH